MPPSGQCAPSLSEESGIADPRSSEIEKNRNEVLTGRLRGWYHGSHPWFHPTSSKASLSGGVGLLCSGFSGYILFALKGGISSERLRSHNNLGECFLEPNSKTLLYPLMAHGQVINLPPVVAYSL